MTTIYLVRHAQAEGNLYRRMHGHYDGQLSPIGKQQLVPLAQRFAALPLDAVFSSDLSRARLTAAAIAQPHRLPVQLDANLREIDVGEWDDLPFGELEQFHAAEYAQMRNDIRHWHVPGAETWEEFTGRFLDALKKYGKCYDGQTIALVTHSMILRCAMERLFPGAFGGYCDNTAVSCVEYDGAGYRLHFAADVTHLPPELSTYATQREMREHPQERYQFWYQSALQEPERYTQFRREAWELVYGSLSGFDGSGFWSTAVKTCEGDPAALVFAMSGNRIAGILQLNVNGYAMENAGYIPFIYLREPFRHKNLGAQLIGYAVQYFRALGRTRLQLSVAPSNAPALRFYEKLEFRRIATTGGRYKLWLMEKAI